MNILTKQEIRARRAAKKLEFKITYMPGLVESLDMYQASNKSLGVCCYGRTRESAIESAQMEAAGILITSSSLTRKILSVLKS